MKKNIILFSLAMSMLLTGCSMTNNNGAVKDGSVAETTAAAKSKETKSSKKNIANASVDDDWCNIAEEEIENCIAALEAEQKELATDIDTYDKYTANLEKVEKFYDRIYEVNKELCTKMYEYSLTYAESVINSGESDKDKYKALEEIYDTIYDDIGDDIYDGIYDGILDDMYDDFYDGILDDAFDNVPYKELSEYRSDEYKLWSRTRSDVYKDWSNSRSDVYSFYSDVRSAMYSGDTEKAEKKIEKFRKEMDKFSGTASANASAAVVKSDVKSTTESSTSADGIRPEFKKAMDAYEEFFDDYIDFMQNYSDSDDALSMLSDYFDYLEKYAEAMDELDDIGDEDMSEKELAYYTEVMLRINGKLLNSYT